MKVNGWGHTDIGRKRDHNEDSILIDGDLGLYAVADGMGGHAAGEVASGRAVQSLREAIVTHRDILEDFQQTDTHETREQLINAVETAIQSACAEIFELATQDKGKAGMGTTLTLMLVVGDKALMAHVGDSRLYLVRQGQLHQLSEDHSYCAEMVKRGKMTREEARSSPYSNVITRAVGIQGSVQVDTLLFDIIPGDTFLICSDGLHSYTDDPNEVVEILSLEEAEQIPEKLIEVANGRGGRDNISAVIVRAVPEGGQIAKDDQRAREVNLKLETLKKIPLFRHLTYQELVKVLNITYLESHEPGYRAFAKRNPNYWTQGRAHFDEVETIGIADVTARATALNTGQIDAMNRFELKTIHLLKRVSGIQIINVTGTKHYSIPMLTDRKPFDNNDVRLALKYAIDREHLLKIILRYENISFEFYGFSNVFPVPIFFNNV